MAEVPDELSVMGADKNSRPFCVDILEQTHDFKGQFCIEIPCRLIRQDDLGAVDDRPRDRHSLLFSVREMRRVFPHFIVQIDHSQGIKDLSPDLLPWNSQHLKDNSHVLEYLFMKDQAKILEDDSHMSPQLIDLMVRDFEDVSVVDDNLSLGGKDLAIQDLEQSGLSGTARSRNETEIPFVHTERDVRKSPLRFLVLLPDVI